MRSAWSASYFQPESFSGLFLEYGESSFPLVVPLVRLGSFLLPLGIDPARVLHTRALRNCDSALLGSLLMENGVDFAIDLCKCIPSMKENTCSCLDASGCLPRGKACRMVCSTHPLPVMIHEVDSSEEQCVPKDGSGSTGANCRNYPINFSAI